MRRTGWILIGAAGGGWVALFIADTYLRGAGWPNDVHGDLRGFIITISVAGLVTVSTAYLRSALAELTKRIVTATEAYRMGRHRRRLDEGDSRELRLVR
jgi:hypothetical protein